MVYLEEVPIQSLPVIQGCGSKNVRVGFHVYSVEMTGHEAGPLVIWNFEYGPDYSGPGYDKHPHRYL